MLTTSLPLRKPSAGASTRTPQSFSCGTVHEYSPAELGPVKAACLLDGSNLFASSRKGIWLLDAQSGRCQEFVRANGTQDLAHSLAVVPSERGPLLWACSGTGSAAIYSVEDGALVSKAFAAHAGCEVPVVLAGVGGYAVTGGADFQVKTWTPEGQLIASSGHNHAPIQCIIALTSAAACVQPPRPSELSAQASASMCSTSSVLPSPRAPSRSTSSRSRPSSSRRAVAAAASGMPAGAAGKLWCGAADGTVSVWSDVGAAGQMSQADWRVLKSEGQKGIKSMCAVGESRVWVGCEDGRVLVYDVGSEQLVFSFRAQAGAVNTMAVVGGQVWAAGDRCINAFDPATGQRLLSLPDQESFVKQLLPGGWVTWVVTFACIKAVTARATGDQLAGQAADLGQRLAGCQLQLAAAHPGLETQALQLQRQEHMMEELTGEVQQLARQLEGEHDQVLHLQEELASTGAALHATAQQAKAAEAQFSSTQQRLAAAEHDWAAQRAVAASEAQQLHSQAEALTQQLRQQGEALTKLSSEHDALSAAHAAAVEASDQQRSQLSVCQTELKAANAQLDACHSQLAASQAACKQLEASVAEATAGQAGAHAQASKLAEQLQASQAALAQAEAAASSSAASLLQAGQRAQQLEQDLSASQAELAAAHALAQASQAAAQQVALEAEDQLAAMCQEAAAAQHAAQAGQEAACAAADRAAAREAAMQQELEAAAAQQQELEEQLAAVQGQQAAAADETAALQQALAAAQQERDEAVDHVAELRAAELQSAEVLQAMQQQLEAVQQQAEAAQYEAALARQEYALARQQLEAAGQQVAALQLEQQQASTALDAGTSKAAHLRGQLDALQGECDELQATCSQQVAVAAAQAQQLEQARTEIAAAAEQLQALRSASHTQHQQQPPGGASASSANGGAASAAAFPQAAPPAQQVGPPGPPPAPNAQHMPQPPSGAAQLASATPAAAALTAAALAEVQQSRALLSSLQAELQDAVQQRGALEAQLDELRQQQAAEHTAAAAAALAADGARDKAQQQEDAQERVDYSQLQELTEELTAKLNAAMEDRYQVQVALRAATKQQHASLSSRGTTPAPGKLTTYGSSGGSASDWGGCRMSSPAPGQHDCCSGCGRCSGTGLAAAEVAKMHQLEGALRQAASDYQLLLSELVAVRQQMEGAGAAAAAWAVERGALHAQLARLGGELEQARTEQQRAAPEAGGPLIRTAVAQQLETAHSAVLQRISSSAGSGGVTPRQAKPPAGALGMPGQQPAVSAQAGKGAAAAGGGVAAPQERVRYLATTGYV